MFTFQVNFAKAVTGTLPAPHCKHKYVNAGFNEIRLVCSLCDQPLPSQKTPFPDVMAIPPANINYVRLPMLRGFSEVRELFSIAKRYCAVIAGGYGKYCASPTADAKKSQDLDIFPGRTGDAKKLAMELVERGFSVVKETDFSYTLNPPEITKRETPQTMVWKTFRNPVQIVKSDFLGSKGWRGVDGFSGFEDLAERVLSTFDLTIVRVAIIGAESVLADARFWEDEVAARLRVEGFRNQRFLYHRLAKYGSRGYTFDPKQVLALFDSSAILPEQKAWRPIVESQLQKVASNPQWFSRQKDALITDSGEYLPEENKEADHD
jgi:hypothetical protein